MGPVIPGIRKRGPRVRISGRQIDRASGPPEAWAPAAVASASTEGSTLGQDERFVPSCADQQRKGRAAAAASRVSGEDHRALPPVRHNSPSSPTNTHAQRVLLKAETAGVKSAYYTARSRNTRGVSGAAGRAKQTGYDPKQQAGGRDGFENGREGGPQQQQAFYLRWYVTAALHRMAGTVRGEAAADPASRLAYCLA